MVGSMTQQAKTLYQELVDKELVSENFSGLLGDSVWIADRKAYRLRDLSSTHLWNITFMYATKQLDFPTCLKEEAIRRGLIE